MANCKSQIANPRDGPSFSGNFQFAISNFQFSIPLLRRKAMALIASHWRFVALSQPLLVRNSMTTDAQIMKSAFRPLFVPFTIPGVSRITLAAVTRNTLHEYRHAARLRALVMTADALSALLPLVWEIGARVDICFVMPVPVQNDAPRASKIEFHDSGGRVIRMYPVAINLLIGRSLRRCRRKKRARQQRRRQRDRVHDENCQLESQPIVLFLARRRSS